MPRKTLPTVAPCHSRDAITRVGEDTLWCSTCCSHVLDLSALDQTQALEVARRIAGTRACVNYRTHSDGSVVFATRAASLTPVFMLALACATASTADAIPLTDPSPVGAAEAGQSVHVEIDTNARSIEMPVIAPPDDGATAAHALVGAPPPAPRELGLGHVGNLPK